jgi:hypothetical protein
MKKIDKQHVDITLNLSEIYKWGDFSPYSVEEETEELVEISERLKENQKQLTEQCAKK